MVPLSCSSEILSLPGSAPNASSPWDSAGAEGHFGNQRAFVGTRTRHGREEGSGVTAVCAFSFWTICAAPGQL